MRATIAQMTLDLINPPWASPLRDIRLIYHDVTLSNPVLNVYAKKKHDNDTDSTR